MEAQNVSSFLYNFRPGILNSPDIKGWAGGKIWFVDSTAARGTGETPDSPLQSIGGTSGVLYKMLNQNRTNKGDLVLVAAGHTESISAADYLSDMGALAGFSIIGMGTGARRPTLTWTAAGSTLLMDTANVEIANMNLYLAGAHAAGAALTVAAPITVSGASCRLSHCSIWTGFDVDQIVGDGITWTGVDGKLLNNRIFGAATAVPTNSHVLLTGADRIEIRGNWIKGTTDGTTRGVIYGATTESIDVDITYNYLNNTTGSSTIAMSLLANSTGSIAYNRCFVASGILPFTASIGEWHENYVVNGAGEAGALVGTASA